MKPSTSRPLVAILATLLISAWTGCGRDTKVNSDPGPGRPSHADGGDRAVRPDPNQATAPKTTSSSTVGTDSTGRPSDASGGTTGAGAGSGTSGTATDKAQATGRK